MGKWIAAISVVALFASSSRNTDKCGHLNPQELVFPPITGSLEAGRFLLVQRPRGVSQHLCNQEGLFPHGHRGLPQLQMLHLGPPGGTYIHAPGWTKVEKDSDRAVSFIMETKCSDAPQSASGYISLARTYVPRPTLLRHHWGVSLSSAGVYSEREESGANGWGGHLSLSLSSVSHGSHVVNPVFPLNSEGPPRPASLTMSDVACKGAATPGHQWAAGTALC